MASLGPTWEDLRKEVSGQTWDIHITSHPLGPKFLCLSVCPHQLLLHPWLPVLDFQE